MGELSQKIAARKGVQPTPDYENDLQTALELAPDIPGFELTDHTVGWIAAGRKGSAEYSGNPREAATIICRAWLETREPTDDTG